MNQKGIAPIVAVIAVSVLLLGGFLIYINKSPNETSKTNQIAKENQAPSNSPESSPDDIENGVSPSPSAANSAKLTSKPTQTPSPTPTPKPELTASFSPDGSEYRVFASWKNVPNPTGGDWLGVFPFGEKGDSPLGDKIYTEGCAKKPESNNNNPGLSLGSCPMYLPLDNGSYEVRLYSNDSTLRLTTSNKTTVVKP